MQIPSAPIETILIPGDIEYGEIVSFNNMQNKDQDKETQLEIK